MSCYLRRCGDCGFPLGKKEVFCPRCGAKQRRDKADPDIIGPMSPDMRAPRVLPTNP